MSVKIRIESKCARWKFLLSQITPIIDRISNKGGFQDFNKGISLKDYPFKIDKLRAMFPKIDIILETEDVANW